MSLALDCSLLTNTTIQALSDSRLEVIRLTADDGGGIGHKERRTCLCVDARVCERKMVRELLR